MAFDFQQFDVMCRLTRDPEPKKKVGDRYVIKFGVAFTGERRKVNDKWEDKPCYMDCEAWQGEYGAKLVDMMDKHGAKGVRVRLIGTLKMDEWTDKQTDQKRRAIKMTVKEIVWLDKLDKDGAQRDRGDDEGGSGSNDDGGGGYGSGGGGNDPIPF